MSNDCKECLATTLGNLTPPRHTPMTDRHIYAVQKNGFWGALRLNGASGHVADLNSSLRQLGPLGQLLPRVDVGIVRAFEGPLQLLQLLRSEGCATAALLPLQRQARL